MAGAVQAPRIDLCNRELLVTHLHALAITAIGLPGLLAGSDLTMDSRVAALLRPGDVVHLALFDERRELHRGREFRIQALPR